MKIEEVLIMLGVFLLVITSYLSYANYSIKQEVLYVDSVNYWQNVFPSEQCAGINYKQMDLFRMPHKTGSMRPTIYSNDLLLTVEYNSSKSLVLGDIVGNGKSLHRIVRMSDLKEEYITKGDNNKDEDSTRISWNETKYVVCGILRGTI